jgi:hypothetical protein
MQDANMTALAALIADAADAFSPEAASVAPRAPAWRTAVPLHVHTAAMSRLSSVLDAAPGADFLAFTGSGHWAHKAPAGQSDARAGSCGLAAVVQLLLHCMQAQLAGQTLLNAHAQQQLKRQLLDSARQVCVGGGGFPGLQQAHTGYCRTLSSNAFRLPVRTSAAHRPSCQRWTERARCSV